MRACTPCESRISYKKFNGYKTSEAIVLKLLCYCFKLIENPANSIVNVFTYMVKHNIEKIII